MSRQLKVTLSLLLLVSCATTTGGESTVTSISTTQTSFSTTQPTQVPTTSTTSPPASSTSAAAPLSMNLSLPSSYFTTGYVHLEGTVNREALVTVNGNQIPTTSMSGGVTFWQEFEVAEPVSEIRVEAAADGEVVQETVTVRRDPALIEQLAYVSDVDVAGSTLTADYVEMLHGEEALAAAREDGFIQPDEELPGDFYIRNQNPLLRTLNLPSTIAPILLACYPDGPCLRQIPVDLETWAELRAEYQFDSPTAGGWSWYGGGQLPYTLTFADEQLVQVTEFYLP